MEKEMYRSTMKELDEDEQKFFDIHWNHEERGRLRGRFGVVDHVFSSFSWCILNILQSRMWGIILDVCITATITDPSTRFKTGSPPSRFHFSTHPSEAGSSSLVS